MELFFEVFSGLESHLCSATHHSAVPTEALEAHPEEFPYASPIACAHRIMPLKDEPEIQDEKGIEPERFLKVFSMFSYTMLEESQKMSALGRIARAAPSRSLASKLWCHHQDSCFSPSEV